MSFIISTLVGAIRAYIVRRAIDKALRLAKKYATEAESRKLHEIATTVLEPMIQRHDNQIDSFIVDKVKNAIGK